MPPLAKKFRFYYRFFTALITTYWQSILVGVLFGSIAFLFAPRLFRLVSHLHSTYTIAYVARPTLSELPLEIQRQISSGLTFTDTAGLPQPALSTGWQATDSGKTYIFTLQKNLRWHDGSPVKSSHIKYQFKDAKIEYPDDHTLKISLPDPFAPLPILASRPVFKDKLIGTGSYRAVSIRKNGPFIESLTLSPITPGNRQPQIKYIFYLSEKTARAAFKLGLVNSIADLTDPQELSDWPNSRVTTTTKHDRYVAVFFNTQSPLFTGSAGKSVRQALALAIDKSRWPGDQRAIGPLSPTSWAYSSDVKNYDQDLDRAKQLLQKNAAIPFPTLTLSTLPAYLSVAEMIKSDWQALGLTVEISVVPEAPSDFSALIAAQAIPKDPDQYYLWHSTQPGNITHTNHPRLDKLLEDGRKTLDPEVRRDLYLDFQKALVEEAPAVFLYYPQIYSVSRSK